MKESPIKKRIRLALAKAYRIVTYCNNRGTGWMGKFLGRTKDGTVMMSPGTHPVDFGMTDGASDLIGYRPLKIEPKHVGKTIAVFVAIECKQPGKKMEDDQADFVNCALRNGALAGMADSEESALAIVEKL